jgi:hypothetical protein
VGHWGDLRDVNLLYATHPMFRFCLLDRLLDAYGFP